MAASCISDDIELPNVGFNVKNNTALAVDDPEMD
jgi:hypothetical protein